MTVWGDGCWRRSWALGCRAALAAVLLPIVGVEWITLRPEAPGSRLLERPIVRAVIVCAPALILIGVLAVSDGYDGLRDIVSLALFLGIPTGVVVAPILGAALSGFLAWKLSAALGGYHNHDTLRAVIIVFAMVVGGVGPCLLWRTIVLVPFFDGLYAF